MGDKRKPRDEIKKTKKSKSQNQVLLSQYFPNLNQNKTKDYQKILTKPNAIFKEQKKLNKSILSEQNQIIKQINRLFREIFQQANHEQINRLAQIFHPTQQSLTQKIDKQIQFSRYENNTTSNLQQSQIYMSPHKKPIENKYQQNLSSQHTRTVTARKHQSFNLTDFQFHESKYKENEKQKNKAQRKYSQLIVSPEETIILFKPLAKCQLLMQGSNCIDWNLFEFKTSLTKIDKSAQKFNEKIEKQIEENLNVITDNQPQIEETITVVQLNDTLKKSLTLKLSQPMPDKILQFNSIKACNEKEESEKIQERSIFGGQVQNYKKSPKMQQNEEQQVRLSFLNINCESATKRQQIQEDQQIGKKLKEGINKIIELNQKKHKAKQQEINFRRYVQQVKQKSLKVIPLNAYGDSIQKKENNKKQYLPRHDSRDLKFDREFNRKWTEDEQQICHMKRRKKSTSNTNTNLDVLNCILDRECCSQFVCYLDGDESDESPKKQISYKIQDQNFEICIQSQDQDSTKQKSEQSSNTVSSQSFISYLDSLQPSFDLPKQYLTGYSRQTFNQSLFRQIHEIVKQKARYETQIQSQII